MRTRSALLALLLLAGCGKRERLNPFDPGNPLTQGRPAGFVALAGDSQVRLRWEGVSAPEIAGYQLFRRVEGESTYRALTSVLAPRTTSVRDFGLLNGLPHHYRLYYVFASGTATLPAEDVAVPGPVRPWVSDGTRGSLARLSADGRHVAFEDASYSGPAGIAADVAGGRVWITDPPADQVVVYDPSTTNAVVIAVPLASPSAVALDPVDGTAWVCAAGINQVLHFNSSGASASPAQLVSIDFPIDVAVDPTDRSLWVCERGLNRVRRYSVSGAPIGASDVMAPSRVAVDSATREAWVTSFSLGQVVRLSPAPAPLDTIGGFRGPIGVAVDARRGRIWVADALGNQVVALRRLDNSVEFRVPGLSEVRAIAVDLASGEAWCTVRGAGRVVRLSPGGKVLEIATGLAGPDGIALGFVTP